SWLRASAHRHPPAAGVRRLPQTVDRVDRVATRPADDRGDRLDPGVRADALDVRGRAGRAVLTGPADRLRAVRRCDGRRDRPPYALARLVHRAVAVVHASRPAVAPRLGTGVGAVR